MRADLLHVFGVLANPCRWQARLRNFRAFEDHMLRSGVNLTTVECQYGASDWELPDREGVNRVRIRARDVLWHKENLGNIAARAAGDWQYAATVDGDFAFLDPNWAAETVHALQLHKIVQISSELVFLGPRGEHVGKGTSIMSLYSQARAASRSLGAACYSDPRLVIKGHGYPGGAWAYRRESWNAIGGLLDRCIVGAGDHHMAQGLLELDDRLTQPSNAGAAYSRYVNNWRARAAAAIRRDIGLVPGLATHSWHGKTADRHYPSRWQILQRSTFDPDADTLYDAQGLLQLTGNKPHLRDDLRAYLSGRNEDSTDL